MPATLRKCAFPVAISTENLQQTGHQHTIATPRKRRRRVRCEGFRNLPVEGSIRAKFGKLQFEPKIALPIPTDMRFFSDSTFDLRNSKRD